ncbi:MAG: glycoside hydrolase family 38 C-terminal domain-containing protein [Gemmatimonadales bacterium]|nr:glycoside hydrolase family 38 C-terminal domain-containing protein [Gemmatimonadales bacterium]
MTAYIFHLIPHTHWDREWYLPRAAFQARLIPMIDDLIARLQNDGALRSFLLDGQTVLVEDYLRARPERESDLKALVKTGRLQVGPWYVLVDELIPSGESLLRNLLLGAADAERLGGRLDVLYSPDAFGHPSALPAVARELGIKFGVVWRGLGGGAGTSRERDLYRWTGRGDRDLLIWHFPPDGYEIGAALPGSGAALPDRWARVRAALVARASGKHIPLFIGADHHALHPNLTGLRDLLAELEPASAFRISRLDEFFQAADAPATAGTGGGRPAAVAGELRWSYGYTWTLQGVHGTRAPFKRRHGAVELCLERCAEPLAALARRHGGTDRRPLLDLAWRTLVRSQFHDTLAGTVIDSVAAAATRRLEDVRAYAHELATGSLHELTGYDPDVARERADVPSQLVLWNPAARARGGVVVADVNFFRRDVRVGPGDARVIAAGSGAVSFSLQTHDAPAKPVPVQLLARQVTHDRLDAARHYPDLDEVDQVRVAFRAPAVPGLGLAVLESGPPVGLPGGELVRVAGRTLSNRWVDVTLERGGGLTLVDRRTKQRYEGLLVLEDEGDAGDAYTFCPAVRGRQTRSRDGGPIRVRRLAPGPLVAALEARYVLIRGVDVRLVVQLYADSPLIRCTLDLDNQRTHHRLRARVPIGIAGVAATAGAAFGTEQRPAVAADPSAYPRETPVRTAPAQRFVAACRETRGLAVLAPAFFEYEWTTAGDFLITVLRAIGDLSRDDLPTRPGHAAWVAPIPAAQCRGMTRLELAVTPVSTVDLERGDRLPELWEDAFLPVRGRWLRAAGAVTPATAGIALEGTGLVLSAVKPAQTGSPLVLRCYNATGRKTAGAWRFGDGVKTAHRVRADERDAVPLVLEHRGRTVRFVAEPYEIVSILIT